MLNQRAANLPEAAPRKRRTPVLDSDGSEMVLSEKQVNQDGEFYLLTNLKEFLLVNFFQYNSVLFKI